MNAPLPLLPTVDCCYRVTLTFSEFCAARSALRLSARQAADLIASGHLDQENVDRMRTIEREANDAYKALGQHELVQT